MIWEWYVLIGLVPAGLGIVYLGMQVNSYMWPGELVVANVLVWLAAFVFLLLALIGTIGPHIDKNICIKFGSQTGFQVKFIKYNTLSWDCLVKANNRWISKSNLQNVIINKDK